MPEFTIEIMQQCRSLSALTAKVGGYIQNLGNERIWPECSCPAYRYAKATINFNGQMVKPACKHITQAEAMRCGWHQLTGQVQTDYEREQMICPKCGGDTEWVRIAV